MLESPTEEAARPARARLKAALVAAAIGAWFFSQAWYGLLASFQNDDMMNMYRAWSAPLWRIVVGNLVPFTSEYRPLGAALYRMLFWGAGLNPLPFRVVLYALLAVNIALLFELARRLSGSAEIGALAALLGGYHHRLVDIYLNNGTIYDVVCYTFTMLALLWYIHARERGFTAWRVTVLYLLWAAAINAKEMAAALPLLFIAYELVYWRKTAFEWRTWVFGDGRWALLSVAATAIAVRAKIAAGGPFSGVPEYVVHLGVRQFFRTSRPLLSHLFLRKENAFETVGVVALYLTVFAIAWLSRNKTLRFAAIFLFVTPLPILFIQYRGFFVMYLPLAGWAIFAAASIVEGRDWLWRKVWRRPPLAPGSWEPERVFTFLVLLYALFAIEGRDEYVSLQSMDASQANISAAKTQMARLQPQVPKSASILFLRDAFPPDEWTPLYLLRLLYRDETLTVDRVKMFPAKAFEVDNYALVFDYRDGQYVRAGGPGR